MADQDILLQYFTNQIIIERLDLTTNEGEDDVFEKEDLCIASF